MNDDPLLDGVVSGFHGADILVTGHTGFKGAWLVALLQHLGATVHGLALDPEPGALFDLLGLGDRCRSDVRAPITDLNAVRQVLRRARPDLVLHLAAEALVRRSYREPLQTFATNVMGTATLLEAARLDRPELPIVVVTSDKVYRNNGASSLFEEQSPLGGRDPYSASKAGAEGVVDCYRDSFGLRLATVRAGNVIGGGDIAEDRLLPDAIRAWGAGRSVRVRNPRATRPWQHVLDPLFAYLEVASRLHAGDSGIQRGWNIGPSEPPWTVGSVLDEACKHWPGARWKAQPEGDAPHEALHLGLSPTQSRAHLAWRPAWGTEQAIAKTVRWSHHRAEGADPWRLVQADIDAFMARAAA